MNRLIVGVAVGVAFVAGVVLSPAFRHGNYPARADAGLPLAVAEEPEPVHTLDDARQEWQARVASGQLEPEDFPLSLAMAIELIQFVHNGGFGGVGLSGLSDDMQRSLRDLTVTSLRAGWNFRKLAEDCGELLPDDYCAELIRASAYEW